MIAGGSAAQQAHLALQRARHHEAQAEQAHAEVGRFTAAATTERRVVDQLGRLSAHGYAVLADRAWPGSAVANVDCVVVGPGGVFIVDPKCWAEVTFHDGRIHRAGEDVTPSLSGLADLADTTRDALAEVGLPPRQVHPVAVLAGWGELSRMIGGVEVVGERSLLARIVGHGERLRPDQVDAVTAACIGLFPSVAARNPRTERVVQPRPPKQRTQADPDQVGSASCASGPLAESGLDGGPSSPDAAPDQATPHAPSTGSVPSHETLSLLSEAELHEAVLGGKLRAPIEEWMSFLHPDQARLVRRSASGPARLRGAAGTGKTVLALHRAAWLAHIRPDRILVTGFVKTIPAVMKGLYQSLAPESASRVDFMSVHAVAGRLLGEAGVHPRISDHGGRLEFERAWSRVGVRGLLSRGPLDRDYWREEIDAVIKGRGLTDFDAYAALRRVGRRYPLSAEQRVAVWDLYLAYQQCLQARGEVDFNDVLIQAEQFARRERPGSRYGTVIVDEVQDLTCVGLRLLHNLVGDAADGLLLVGDGQQAIYPGGFTLAEAGVDVRGRSTVLRRNYRNTVEILAAAQRVVAGDRFSDLDDLEELGQRDVIVTRHGPEPAFVTSTSRAAVDRALVEEIDRIRELPGRDLAGIGVLVPGGSDVHRYLGLLAKRRIPAMNLEDYQGRPVAKVKVGTYHRAKGLDFAHVLLPGWRLPEAKRGDTESESALRERVERDRRTLFVAMTRARDELWLAQGPG
ncbi:MAG: UvrD-helicase domain-containing protein [Actinomycetales bacterium]